MEKRFRYIPHTADIGFIAYGRTFGKAIESSVLAMITIMFDMKKLDKHKARVKSITIKEKAKSEEDLVWFTLQRVLQSIQIKSLSPLEFKVGSVKKSKEGLQLSGKLLYAATDSEKYGLLEVKAVTPHELSVTRKDGMFRIKVIVDI